MSNNLPLLVVSVLARLDIVFLTLLGSLISITAYFLVHLSLFSLPEKFTSIQYCVKTTGIISVGRICHTRNSAFLKAKTPNLVANILHNFLWEEHFYFQIRKHEM